MFIRFEHAAMAQVQQKILWLRTAPTPLRCVHALSFERIALMTSPWPSRLWIVRHGQSAGNVARDRAHAAGLGEIDLGFRDVDVPLSDLGFQQSEALGQWFAALPVEDRPTVVLTSTYLRAQQTATAIANAGGLAKADLAFCVDERLREREFGILALPPQEEAKLFAQHADGRAILTPHAGEMASMLGRNKDAIKADPLAAAREAALMFQSVVVMKGVITFVVSPDGTAWRHDGGVKGLGTSGSGDVLAGAIGGILARGASPVSAAMWGVVLHAEAGSALARAGKPIGFLARELLDQLAFVLGRIEAALDGKS